MKTFLFTLTLVAAFYILAKLAFAVIMKLTMTNPAKCEQTLDQIVRLKDKTALGCDYVSCFTSKTKKWTGFRFASGKAFAHFRTEPYEEDKAFPHQLSNPGHGTYTKQFLHTDLAGLYKTGFTTVAGHEMSYACGVARKTVFGPEHGVFWATYIWKVNDTPVVMTTFKVSALGDSTKETVEKYADELIRNIDEFVSTV